MNFSLKGLVKAALVTIVSITASLSTPMMEAKADIIDIGAYGKHTETLKKRNIHFGETKTNVTSHIQNSSQFNLEEKLWTPVYPNITPVVEGLAPAVTDFAEVGQEVYSNLPDIQLGSIEAYKKGYVKETENTWIETTDVQKYTGQDFTKTSDWSSGMRNGF